VTSAAALLVISLTGISGAHYYESTPEQVAAHWRTPIHFVWTGDHPGIGTAPLCGRNLVGAAIFGGTGDGPDVSLRSAWFLRGARTDEGVGIGTSLAALRSTYGARLAPTKIYAYGPAATDRQFMVASQSPPRTVIVFGLVRSRVRLLGWGLLQSLGGEAFPAPGGIRC
jgi:hypothetical protein